MTFSIHQVNTSKDLKRFIKFPMKLYKGHSSYVPPIISFEQSTLRKDKNPAFEHAIAEYWVVKDANQEIVGRIAGIILDEEKEEKQYARFGWIDFIDNTEVFHLLIHTVEQWALKHGCTQLHGPLGFTDLDFEGTLIEGFDQLATQATIYNAPYYQSHFEKYGFAKACDWVEFLTNYDLPDKYSKATKLIEQRYKLRRIELKNKKQLLQYTDQIFELLNSTYADLYGYYPLTKAQINYYTNLYFDFVVKDFVNIIVNEENQVVAFSLCVPSLSSAFQKAKGSLYPFGFIHVLKAFYRPESIDFFLICAQKELQNKGLPALLLYYAGEALKKHKIRKVHTGPMLTNNTSMLNLIEQFRKITKGYQQVTRRCFIKEI
ncbi:MAG: hypothetical protein ACPGJS_10340 [Flammeovirgaceae bacterium]